MASAREFGSFGHLAGRFFGSLVPVGPTATDERWARDHLLDGERTLWQRMSPADRRHAAGVARRAVAELDRPGGAGPAGREVVAAALLHDVGKIDAALGTWARVGVTLAAIAVGRARLLAWSGGSEAAGGDTALGARRWRRRIGLYLSHDRAGADLLRRAGSDPVTIAWTAEHHRPPERWSVDARVGAALKVADDD
jgi:hypothetical protein